MSIFLIEPFLMSAEPSDSFLTSSAVSEPFLTFAPVISAPATAVPVSEKSSARTARTVVGLSARIFMVSSLVAVSRSTPVQPGRDRFLTRAAKDTSARAGPRVRNRPARGCTGMNTHDTHHLLDVDEAWIAEWAADGLAAIEQYLAKHASCAE